MSSNEAMNQSEDGSQPADNPAEATESMPESGAEGSRADNAPAFRGQPAPEETHSPEDLRLMLEDARSRADEHWDALLRTKAEMDNLRKRATRDVEQAHKYGAEQYIAEILPVWDSLEMGLSAASEEGADLHKVREGMELTLKMLAGALEKMGVQQIDPAGEAFDPERHQAMTMQETDAVPPGTVTTVVQKGYTLNDRLMRPALVMVARKPQ
ncbi:MAG: nucleotide exchange factor GrpE [Gammaproteobacteria bacterium]|nr:nucleotide exchange factor GrpE [Gammaproteobacteria bacterium]